MEPNDILGAFFSLRNPAIFVGIIMVILIVIGVMVKKEFIIPQEKRIKELEKENDRLAEKIKEYLWFLN